MKGHINPVLHTKQSFFFVEVMAVCVSPGIIVQGGGFLESASCDKYRQVTERAATVGYDILMVSV